ncbi:MAG: hypothetical protein Kow0070_15050 [Anaerolineales bacterium]
MADTPPLKVFLCHASEDKPIVRELYERLRADGFAPWLDSEALLPGQDWDLEIQKAMRASDAVIVCFSSVSVSKEGYVQKEIKYAQEIQQEKPEGTIFFIPLQLEACEMPFRLRGIHWGHYYEPDGYEKLVQALNVRAGQRPHPAFGAPLPQGEGKGVRENASAASIAIGRDASQSVAVAGAGNVLNVHYGAAAAPGWHRPAAPRPSKPMVGRKEDFNQVAEWLKSGRNAAITAAVQGTPGVGKTVLAENLAAALDGEFPGGVIFKQLGAGFRDPILANPILAEWAALAGKAREENAAPNPDEVRTLLAGHGDLLVVLDDVWDLEAVQPLLQALPKEACLLITTRSRRIAQELHGEIYPLDVLTDEDARELLKRRVHPTDAEMPLLERLAKALGNHAQALDIAAGSLARLPHNRWKAAVEEMEPQVREGSGFGELRLTEDEEKEERVEAALAFSYYDLKPETQKRFRSLGAFAPDASFGAEAAAGVWKLDSVEDAENQLTALLELGLLGYAPQSHHIGRGAGGEGAPRWQQHAILRAYALALLKKEGEEESARNTHAQTYNELMRQADNRQTYFLLLPDHPQLQHAFAWAIEHDPGLAQSLAGNTANLQAAFSLVRESYSWAKQLVEKSRDQDENTKGAAIGTLGNALSRLASLPRRRPPRPPARSPRRLRRSPPISPPRHRPARLCHDPGKSGDFAHGTPAIAGRRAAPSFCRGNSVRLEGVFALQTNWSRALRRMGKGSACLAARAG